MRLSPRLPGGARWRCCRAAGAGEFKRWGEDNYLELCGKLSARDPELNFLWILGPQEAGIEEKVFASPVSSKSRILAGAPLGDLAAAAFACTWAVGNDCGPAHIFQMCGVPFTCVMSDHDGRGPRRADEWLDFPNVPYAVFSTPGTPISTVKAETVLNTVRKMLQARSAWKRPARRRIFRLLTD